MRNTFMNKNQPKGGKKIYEKKRVGVEFGWLFFFVSKKTYWNSEGKTNL